MDRVELAYLNAVTALQFGDITWFEFFTLIRSLPIREEELYAEAFDFRVTN